MDDKKNCHKKYENDESNGKQDHPRICKQKINKIKFIIPRHAAKKSNKIKSVILQGALKVVTRRLKSTPRFSSTR